MNEVRKGPGCLKIFLWVVGISALIIAAVTYYVATNLGTWTRAYSAKGVEAMAEETLKQVKLPPADKEQLREILNQFAQDIRDEKVSMVQGMAVMAELAAGPLMMSSIATEVRDKYITYSDLSMEEKQDGVLHINRLLRGVFENKIDPKQLESIVNMTTEQVVNSEGEEGTVPRAGLSISELRKVIAKAKQLSDAAAIPEEEYTPHFPTVVREAIKRGLKTNSIKDLEKRFGDK